MPQPIAQVLLPIGAMLHDTHRANLFFTECLPTKIGSSPLKKRLSAPRDEASNGTIYCTTARNGQ
jgi:hypothetical protein